MSESMIERVARALDELQLVGDLNFQTTEARMVQRCLQARAAIEAMREPTEAMQEAALRTIICENKGVEYGPSLGWKAMIDAALERTSK